MAWLGKIIGGTVGFMLGGPIGMIAGAVFGGMFDKAQQLPGNNRTAQNNGFFGFQGTASQSPFGNQASAREQAQMVFFVGAFSMLARIASADGNVSVNERRKIEEFIRRDLKLDPRSQAVAMQVFETALNNQSSFEQLAVQFYQNFRTNRQLLELMIDIFYRVSSADGAISSSEEVLIRQAGSIFQFSADEMRLFRRRYSGSSGSSAAASAGGAPRSYAVLGVQPTATDAEIKRAYRKLVSEYHPDKIASKGLPEEFITFASDKFREIQAAYEDLRSSRGL